MKIPSTTLILLIIACLAMRAAAAEPSIAVTVHLCEIPAGTEMPNDILQLLGSKGVDAASLPPLLTPSGESVKASVTREFSVSGKGEFTSGVVLTIRPTLEDERFRYSVDFDYTEFVGVANRSATQAPIFKITRIIGLDGTCASEEPVWLDLHDQERQQTVSAPGKPDIVQTLRTKLIAIISFKAGVAVTPSSQEVPATPSPRGPGGGGASGTSDGEAPPLHAAHPFQ